MMTVDLGALSILNIILELCDLLMPNLKTLKLSFRSFKDLLPLSCLTKLVNLRSIKIIEIQDESVKSFQDLVKTNQL